MHPDSIIRSEDAPVYAPTTPRRPPVPLACLSTRDLLAIIGADANCDGPVPITRLRAEAAPDSPIAAAFEIASRWHEERLDRGEEFTTPAHVSRFLALHLRDLPNEAFAVLFLDNRHRRIAFEIMFRGTVDGTSVFPRPIIQRALELNAAAVVLAHNHPSGIAEPSFNDRAMTNRIKDACSHLDIRVIDHFVIGNGEVVSFAERGLL